MFVRAQAGRPEHGRISRHARPKRHFEGLGTYACVIARLQSRHCPWPRVTIRRTHRTALHRSARRGGIYDAHDAKSGMASGAPKRAPDQPRKDVLNADAMTHGLSLSAVVQRTSRRTSES